MKYFVSKKVNPWVTEILDITGVRCFLVEGTERAAIIDTGVGAGNFREYVKSLTTLPFDVILTHGHVDHAGGAGGFEKVYLSEYDWTLEKIHCTKEMKVNYVKFAAPFFEEKLKEGGVFLEGNPEFLCLKDGMEFHLGGITLQMIRVPGHTEGMMCVLFKELRTLLLGDACNDRTFLFEQEACSIVQYQESLRKLQKNDEKYDKVWFSHGPLEQEKGVVEESLSLTEEILKREDEQIPFEFMGQTAYMAKSVGEDGIHRVDGKHGNIIYSLGKINKN